MRAAYLNQAINLLVSILMVPLLLKFLGLGEYILWALFTTFGGITLQIENSIQIVSVREISREYHAGVPTGMRNAIRRARRAYRLLALGVLVPFTVAGLLYFSYVANDKVSNRWQIEWLIFVSAYALNYYFGANNSILLALGKISAFNYIGSLTRTINFIGTALMLMAGFSIIGVCVSFAISVVISCCLVSFMARATLRDAIPMRPSIVTAGETLIAPGFRDIVRYTLYTFAAFVLYKGGVLLAASAYSKQLIGSYSLTLQSFAMLTSFALVPVQVWLARLMRAIVADNLAEITSELARTLLLSNVVFLIGTGGLLVFGSRLLAFIGASVVLPGPDDLVLVAFAFLVEMNLLVFINLLVSKRQYNFVRIYVVCALTGVGLTTVGIWLTHRLFLSMVVLPLVVQLTVCLPLVLRIVCAELKTTARALARGLLQNAAGRN
jgi:hypothetical protein